VTLYRLSDNVGGVKYISSVRSLSTPKSAISLSLRFAPYPTQRLARNRFQVRNSVRPMHLFGHTLDHDYYFRLPLEGERDTQSVTRC